VARRVDFELAISCPKLNLDLSHEKCRAALLINLASCQKIANECRIF